LTSYRNLAELSTMSAADQLFITVMAGGRGSRFWPWSQPQVPKQFLTMPAVTGRQSLLKVTLARWRNQVPPRRILVVGLAEHARHLRRELRGLPPQNLMLEPMGRNTTATVAAAAHWIRAHPDFSPAATQLVLPADHHIGDVALLHRAVAAGRQLLRQRSLLLTFGIEPQWPETGYGYIECAEKLAEHEGLSIQRAASFREKPPRAQAEQYLKQGSYLWNSGMFLWRVETILEELAVHQPAMVEELANFPWQQRWQRHGRRPWRLPAALYGRLAQVSVDYGVMEKSSRVGVIRTPLKWSDLGGWESLYQLLGKDAAGNVMQTRSHALAEVTDSFFFCPGLEVVALGVGNLVVAFHEGRLLVCDRSRASEIRNAVERLSAPPRRRSARRG
jgi:mannose-1-phosphate guanylyltransferase